MKEKIIEKIKLLLNKGAVHILLGNFLIKFVGLFGSIFIVRFLTKEEYGILGYIENIYSYASIFVGLGISLGIMRYLVIADEDKRKNDLYVFALKFQTAFNLILVASISVFFYKFVDNEFTKDSGYLLNIYLCSLIFLDITQTNLSLERARLENKKYMWMSALSAICSVLFRVIGAYGEGITGVIIGKVLADILVAISITIYIYKSFITKNGNERNKIKNRGEIIKYSFHNMISNGVWILFMITDVFLISHLTSDATLLAEYKVAYMIPSNMAIITSSVIVFIVPYFIKHENDKTWVKNNFLKGIKLNCLMMGTLLILLELLAKPIIYILYGSTYLNVVPLMRILLVAHFINSAIKSFAASLLTSMGYAKENLIISIVGFILQVAMAYNVIPRYGLIGLAIGSCFVYMFIAVCVIITFAVKFDFVKRVEG